MKRTTLALAALVAVPVTPAFAVAEPSGATVGGITYTIPVNAGGGVAGQCTIVADRWTADYGPTDVYAQAVSPNGVWTRVRCTVTKGGTTWVDKEALRHGPYATISAGDGTMPVAGVTVCAEIESQLTVDSRPYARKCQTF